MSIKNLNWKTHKETLLLILANQIVALILAAIATLLTYFCVPGGSKGYISQVNQCPGFDTVEEGLIYFIQAEIVLSILILLLWKWVRRSG